MLLELCNVHARGVSTPLPSWIHAILTSLILNLAYRKSDLEFQCLFLQERARRRAKINTACKNRANQTDLGLCPSWQRLLYKMVDNAWLFGKAHYNSLYKHFCTKIEFFVWIRWAGIVFCNAVSWSVQDVFWHLKWKQKEPQNFWILMGTALGSQGRKSRSGDLVCAHFE